MGPERHALRLVAWELTRACNLACRHCRAAAIDTPQPDELSRDECFALIDQIASFSSPTVILTGGEPLLRPDLFEIAARATERGLRVVAATNGTMLDEPTARKLLHSGVRRISISVDGKNAASHDALRAVPGAFEGALRGVEAARAAGLPFQLNTTVTRENVDELPDIHRLAISLGAVAHHVFLLVPTGRAADYRGLELDAERYEAVLEWLADRTEGYVGADLEGLCKEAGMRALRQDMKAKVVKREHFEEALKATRPSTTKETIKYYEAIREVLESGKPKDTQKDGPGYYA